MFLFRDHGARGARTRARLSFLLESWGVDRFRSELEQRWARPLERAGRDARIGRGTDHIGIHRQKQAGLNYAGLLVAVGRWRRLSCVTWLGRVSLWQRRHPVHDEPEHHRPERSRCGAAALHTRAAPSRSAARSAWRHARLGRLHGIDYCHFALIETKDIAVKTARDLATRLPHDQRVTTHWSGCPAGCGNHAAADIGLLGKNIRVNGELVEAVDVFVGGRAGPNPRPGVRMLEDVPCAELPASSRR